MAGVLARAARAVGSVLPWRLPGRRSRTGEEASWNAVSAWRGWLWGAGDEILDPEAARWLAPVFRCVTLLSDSLAAPWMGLVEELASGGRRVVTEGDAARALALMTFTDKEALFVAFLLTGNGYAEILRNARGGVAGFEVIPPQRVSVAVAFDQPRIWYRVAEDGLIGSPARNVAAEDMIHLRYRVGFGAHNLLGVAPLVCCAKSMDLILRIQGATASVYKNIGLPGFLLATDANLTGEQVTELRKRWNEQTQGDKIGGTAIVTSGLKPTPVPVRNLLEAQVAEMNKASVNDIGRAFGVPSQLLNETGSLNYSTSVELWRAFATMTLTPLATRVASEFSAKLLTPADRAAGTGVHIDLSDLLIGQGTERAEYLSKLVNAGILTPNESRTLLNYAGIGPAGDQVRMPVNTAPGSIWVEGNAAPPQPQQAQAPAPIIG